MVSYIFTFQLPKNNPLINYVYDVVHQGILYKRKECYFIVCLTTSPISLPFWKSNPKNLANVFAI